MRGRKNQNSEREGGGRDNIKSVSLPSRQISSFLRPVKDDLGLRTAGVYSAAGCTSDRLVGPSRPGLKSITSTYG